MGQQRLNLPFYGTNSICRRRERMRKSQISGSNQTRNSSTETYYVIFPQIAKLKLFRVGWLQCRKKGTHDASTHDEMSNPISACSLDGNYDKYLPINLLFAHIRINNLPWGKNHGNTEIINVWNWFESYYNVKNTKYFFLNRLKDRINNSFVLLGHAIAFGFYIMHFLASGLAFA